MKRILSFIALIFIPFYSFSLNVRFYESNDLCELTTNTAKTTVESYGFIPTLGFGLDLLTIDTLDPKSFDETESTRRIKHRVSTFTDFSVGFNYENDGMLFNLQAGLDLNLLYVCNFQIGVTRNTNIAQTGVILRAGVVVPEKYFSSSNIGYSIHPVTIAYSMFDNYETFLLSTGIKIHFNPKNKQTFETYEHKQIEEKQKIENAKKKKEEAAKLKKEEQRKAAELKVQEQERKDAEEKARIQKEREAEEDRKRQEELNLKLVEEEKLKTYFKIFDSWYKKDFFPEEIESLKQISYDDINFQNNNPYGFKSNFAYVQEFRTGRVQQWLPKGCLYDFLGYSSRIVPWSCLALINIEDEERNKLFDDDYVPFFLYVGTYSYESVDLGLNTVPEFDILFYKKY